MIAYSPFTQSDILPPYFSNIQISSIETFSKQVNPIAKIEQNKKYQYEKS